ncbi:MAG: glycosyltransferase family 2 protein, partial [Candidatus Aminicenantes bacterium]
MEKIVESKKTNSDPKISIIIPTLNRPYFLKQSVQSVLDQTVSASEIIIINDGSRNNFKNKIQDITKLNPRISIYHFPKTKGVAVARNFGIGKARGNYLLFLDDDDIILPKMLESCLSVFKQDGDIDVVSCLADIFFSYNTFESFLSCGQKRINRYFSKRLFFQRRINYKKVEQSPFSIILKHGLLINSCLIKKESIGAVRFPEDLALGEDLYFWITLAYRGCRFKFIPKVYALVRQHSGNARLKQRNKDSRLSLFSKLLSSEMVRKRKDLFICHLWHLRSTNKLNISENLRHLGFVLKSPDLIMKNLFWYCTNWLKTRLNVK